MILVTNDDGIDSDGIIALAESLSAVDDICVCAPDRERSAVSHALTLHKPLRAEEIKPKWFAVDGTPTDCVHLAIKTLLEEEPWLVVSGINKGNNLGDDIIYSGTVAGAVEGVLLGTQAFAISQTWRTGFGHSAKFAAQTAEFLKSRPLPPNTLLNINVPRKPVDENPGWRMTSQGQRIYNTKVITRKDPRGKPYYWIGGQKPGRVEETGTDLDVVDKGYISVTPLHLDMTAYSIIEEYNRLKARKQSMKK